MKKSKKKNASYKKSPHRKQVFDDILDLDEEWDEDWEHIEKEADEDDWEEDFHISVSRKILFSTAAGCALLCLAVVIFLFLPSESETAQTAAALYLNPPHPHDSTADCYDSGGSFRRRAGRCRRPTEFRRGGQ